MATGAGAPIESRGGGHVHARAELGREHALAHAEGVGVPQLRHHCARVPQLKLLQVALDVRELRSMVPRGQPVVVLTCSIA